MPLPDNQALLRLHLSGLSLSAIAHRYGISTQAVHQRLGGAKRRTLGLNTKLTEAKVREARRC